MNRYLLLLLGLVLSAPASADGSLLGVTNPADMAGKQGRGAYAAGNYFEGSDYIAARQFSGAWAGDYSPRNGMNLAMLIGRAETGVSIDSWRFAALYRKEIIIESNLDTTNMVHYNKTRQSVPAGQSFNVDLRVDGFAADGFRLDKGFVLSSAKDVTVSLGVGVSLLHGTEVRISQANGTASSTLSGYTYNVSGEDAYSKATYPYIRSAVPTGQGYAFDVGAKIAWSNGARLELAANDLLGAMRWKNMPHTLINANSNTLTRDTSGYIAFNPTVSGVNDINRRTIDQRLDPKLHGQFIYPIANLEVYAGTDWTKGYFFPQAGVTYHFNANWKTMLDYDVRFNTLGLRVEHKWFYLGFRSDNTALAKARAYGIEVGLNMSF